MAVFGENGIAAAKLEDIASRLGFSSAFHLSAAFKQAYGVAPQQPVRHPDRARGQALVFSSFALFLGCALFAGVRLNRNWDRRNLDCL